METKYKYLISILTLGVLILLSYYYFVYLKSNGTDRWWFGLSKKRNFFKIFGVSAFMATISFCYIIWYTTEELEGYVQKKVSTELIIGLVASLLWAPFVYYSFKYRNIKYIAASLLLVVAGTSIAALYFLLDDRADNLSEYDKVGVSALAFFIFHTLVVDGLVWNLYYLKNN